MLLFIRLAELASRSHHSPVLSSEEMTLHMRGTRYSLLLASQWEGVRQGDADAMTLVWNQHLKFYPRGWSAIEWRSGASLIGGLVDLLAGESGFSPLRSVLGSLLAACEFCGRQLSPIQL